MSILRALFVSLCSSLAAQTVFAKQTGPVTLDFTPLGAPTVSNGANAPMDVSFGTYPMSVLGIARAIHHYDGTKRLDDGPIAYAIVAIRDWEHHYPNDPWIARELLAMQRVYEHAHSAEGAAYERAVAMWLENDYPSSVFAISSRSDLAKVETHREPTTPALAPLRAPPKAPATAPPEGETLPSYARPLSGNGNAP